MVTKGEWKVSEYESGGIDIMAWDEGNFNGIICDFMDDEPITLSDARNNAYLITKLHNQCWKINPDNPQAVAEKLEEMYTEIKEAYETLHSTSPAGKGIVAIDYLNKLIKLLSDMEKGSGVK